jgi:hypothetical protein
MSVPRAFSAAATVDGLIYVMGGAFFQGNISIAYSVATSSTEVYDPILDTWQGAPAMQASRRDFAVAVVDSTIFAFFGTSSNPLSFESLRIC